MQSSNFGPPGGAPLFQSVSSPSSTPLLQTSGPPGGAPLPQVINTAQPNTTQPNLTQPEPAQPLEDEKLFLQSILREQDYYRLLGVGEKALFIEEIQPAYKKLQQKLNQIKLNQEKPYTDDIITAQQKLGEIYLALRDSRSRYDSTRRKQETKSIAGSPSATTTHASVTTALTAKPSSTTSLPPILPPVKLIPTAPPLHYGIDEAKLLGHLQREPIVKKIVQKPVHSINVEGEERDVQLIRLFSEGNAQDIIKYKVTPDEMFSMKRYTTLKGDEKPRILLAIANYFNNQEVLDYCYQQSALLAENENLIPVFNPQEEKRPMHVKANRLGWNRIQLAVVCNQKIATIEALLEKNKITFGRKAQPQHVLFGYSLMELAATGNSPIEMVKYLLGKQIETNALVVRYNDQREEQYCMQQKMKLVHYFAQMGYVQALETLRHSDADAKLHEALKDGTTALIIAVKNKQAAAVTFLLQQGADVDQTNKAGDLPLLEAIFLKSVETIVALLRTRKTPYMVTKKEAKTIIKEIKPTPESSQAKLLRGTTIDALCRMPDFLLCYFIGKKSPNRKLLDSSPSVLKSVVDEIAALKFSKHQHPMIGLVMEVHSDNPELKNTEDLIITRMIYETWKQTPQKLSKFLESLIDGPLTKQYLAEGTALRKVLNVYLNVYNAMLKLIDKQSDNQSSLWWKEKMSPIQKQMQEQTEKQFNEVEEKIHPVKVLNK